jgi:hypothetical protein
LTPALAALAYLHTWDHAGTPPGGIAYEPLLRRLKLDYAPASLARVDTFLDALRTAKKPQRESFLADAGGQNLLLLLAFYVAETAGRALGCAPQWLSYETAQQQAPSPSPRVFETSMVCNFPGSAARVTHFAPLVAICDRLFSGSIDKSVAFSAGMVIPQQLQDSTVAPPPAPGFAPALDVPQALSRCGPRDRARLEIVPPPWADRDPLARWFAAAPQVLRSGRVVWAGLVQANTSLFTPEPYGGAPGEVVYDATGRATPEALDEVAQVLLSLKGRRLADPALAAFSDYLTDEMTRVFGLDVPEALSPYPLKVATTFFDRGYLPANVIGQRCFPVLVSDQDPGIVLFLPAAVWPAALLQGWSAR